MALKMMMLLMRHVAYPLKTSIWCLTGAPVAAVARTFADVVFRFEESMVYVPELFVRTISYPTPVSELLYRSITKLRPLYFPMFTPLTLIGDPETVHKLGFTSLASKNEKVAPSAIDVNPLEVEME